MALSTQDVASIVSQYQRADKDTGSTEVQTALLTHRIKDLTTHLNEHKKDIHSRRGLQTYVNRRRKLLGYFKRQNLEAYRTLIKSLELRDSY